jgi:UDP:flavonoid glycosyltransferase YjiC (YdhE family)
VKALLSTVGSRGDVQPMLVLGSELARRGHDVRLAAPPNFAALVARAGLPFIAIGADTDALIEQNKELAEKNPLFSLPAQIALLRRETERQLADLLRVSEPVDVVVAGGLSFGARLLAEKLGARYTYVAYSLAGLRSAKHPPAALPLFGLPSMGNRALWATLVGTFDAALGGLIGRARRAHGLVPAPAWRSIHASSTLLAQDEIMGSVPSDAQGFAARVPALVPEDSGAPLPEAVERFVSARAGGGPNVYVGFGSMPHVDRARLLDEVHEAAHATDANIVFFPAAATDGAADESEHLLFVGELEHAALFPRMDLVVHHGGAGTTATALRAGVPQFLVPHIQDQFFHGRRIHELGLGPEPCPKQKLDAHALFAAIEHSNDYRVRARAVARKLAGRSGAVEAADFLERQTSVQAP